MKVKLTKEQIQAIVDDPKKAQEAGINLNEPWWKIVLKTIAYVIGLILAGATTAGCAHVVGVI